MEDFVSLRYCTGARNRWILFLAVPVLRDNRHGDFSVLTFFFLWLYSDIMKDK